MNFVKFLERIFYRTPPVAASVKTHFRSLPKLKLIISTLSTRTFQRAKCISKLFILNLFTIKDYFDFGEEMEELKFSCGCSY